MTDDASGVWSDYAIIVTRPAYTFTITSSILNHHDRNHGETIKVPVKLIIKHGQCFHSAVNRLTSRGGEKLMQLQVAKSKAYMNMEKHEE